MKVKSLKGFRACSSVMEGCGRNNPENALSTYVQNSLGQCRLQAQEVYQKQLHSFLFVAFSTSSPHLLSLLPIISQQQERQIVHRQIPTRVILKKQKA